MLITVILLRNAFAFQRIEERSPVSKPKSTFERWCLDIGDSGNEKYPGNLQDGFSSSQFYYKDGYQYFIVPSKTSKLRQELRECYSGKYSSSENYARYKGRGGRVPKAFWSGGDKLTHRMKATFNVESVGRPACLRDQKDAFGFNCPKSIRNISYHFSIRYNYCTAAHER